MEQVKTMEEVKFEKSWACAALAEIRDALKDGRTLKATTLWGKKERDPFWNITLLEMIEATLDNIGANEAMAEQDAKRAIEYAQRKAGGR